MNVLQALAAQLGTLLGIVAFGFLGFFSASALSLLPVGRAQWPVLTAGGLSILVLVLAWLKGGEPWKIPLTIRIGALIVGLVLTGWCASKVKAAERRFVAPESPVTYSSVDIEYFGERIFQSANDFKPDFEQVKLSLRWDCLLVFGYLLLIGASVAILTTYSQPQWQVVVAALGILALTAGACDLIENYGLYHKMWDMGRWFATAKFTLLTVVGVAGMAAVVLSAFGTSQSEPTIEGRGALTVLFVYAFPLGATLLLFLLGPVVSLSPPGLTYIGWDRVLKPADGWDQAGVGLGLGLLIAQVHLIGYLMSRQVASSSLLAWSGPALITLVILVVLLKLLTQDYLTGPTLLTGVLTTGIALLILNRMDWSATNWHAGQFAEWHSTLAVIAIPALALGILFVQGLNDPQWGPEVFCFCAMFSIALATYGALSFYLRGGLLTAVLLGFVLLLMAFEDRLELPELDYDAPLHALGETRRPDFLRAEALLASHPDTVVIVRCPGGAFRAAYWSLEVLKRCHERGTGKNVDKKLMDDVMFITGASGGHVGAGFLIAQQYANDNWDVAFAEAEKAVTANCQRLMLKRWVTRDLTPIRFFTRNGRATSLLEQWNKTLNKVTFAQLLEKEKTGKFPVLIYTPALKETGGFVLISNLHYQDVLPPKRSQVGVVWPWQKPQNDQLQLGHAMLMTAAFPYITPAVSLPVYNWPEAVDAGYFDGGLLAACQLALKLGELDTNRTRRLLLIDIRNDAYKDPWAIKPDVRFAAAITTPLQGAAASFGSQQRARDELLLARVEEAWKGRFTHCTFAYGGASSMNWGLTDGDTKDITEWAEAFMTEEPKDSDQHSRNRASWQRLLKFYNR